MNRHPRLLAFALCVSALAPAAAPAQTQAPANAAQKKPAAKKPKADAADPMAEVRRASAVSLVSTLADEARAFSEPALRARVQARSADALWDSDKEKARQLFRRAWEAAEAADRDTANLSEEERRRRAVAQGGAGARGLLNMRREVVILAARRDKEMGEEFLSKLDDSRKDEAGATNAPPAPVQPNEQRINPDNPPPHMQQRLNLAQQLLDEGDVDRAMQFADPALYPVNTFGVAFLNTLRGKNKAAADERFMLINARAAADPLSDANSVSLLASYVFTPFLYVTVRPDGRSHTRQWRGDISPPADMEPRVREAFLSTAFTVLLRPLPPAVEDRTSSGRMGAYVVATRMLPLFERHAPDRAPALRARQAQLAQDTPDRGNQIDERLLTRGIVPEDPNRDEVQEALNRLETAKTSGERDRIYFRAAMAAAEKDPARAREFANKIEDPDTRRQLLAFMAYQQVQEAVRAKKPDDVLRHARSDELTRMQRVWGLTEAARLLAKEQPGRAAEALDEAAAEARKVEDGTPDRVRALLAVATQLVALDRARAWETMHEVVKAANDLPTFSGEGGEITARVEFKGGGAMTQNSNVDSFDLTGVFAALAREDFDRAAALARTLKAEAPRSVATLAVARSVLVKKQEPGVAAN
jgi:hypothetical protein